MINSAARLCSRSSAVIVSLVFQARNLPLVSSKSLTSTENNLDQNEGRITVNVKHQIRYRFIIKEFKR